MIGNKLLRVANKINHGHDSKIRFVGILPRPKANKYSLKKNTKKYKKSLATGKTLRKERLNASAVNSSQSISGIDFVERDVGDSENSESDSIRTDSDEEIQNISNEIVNRNFLACTNDLELCFIFISTDVHGTKEAEDNDDDDEEGGRPSAKSKE
tara:strand:- start:1524 stop:1988 length:465 start_codon:yes stop_codon:yes gene_type:complete